MNFLLDFKNYLLSQKEPSSKLTVKNYLSDVRRFIAWFEKNFGSSFSPELITPQIVDQFKKSNNLAMSSIERNLSSLRKFFNFLMLEGIVAENPLKIENLKLKTEKDPWHLKEFKDYLYIYNASRLTIKNYLMDIKSFIAWTEEVTISKSEWDTNEKNLFGKINNNLVEEYKSRLNYSPRTINRKLSSLRKFITWAKEKGYIHYESQISNLKSQKLSSNLENFKSKNEINHSSLIIHHYSSFPPLRLLQKTAGTISFLTDYVLVNTPASFIKNSEHLIWRIKGKPVFEVKIQGETPVKNIKKEFYSPLLISTKHFPIYKKAFFYIRHNRPQWYKTYHSYALSHYLHIAVLVLVMSALGFGVYQNISEKPLNQGVLGITNPKSPPRVLSFQGRLTDSLDNPIITKTNLRFSIYNALTGTGSALMWQEVDSVTPDANGIFSVLLGNVSTMQQNLFAEHAGLWLGVTVGQTAELTPRQQLATVAYAENSETLQGLPPITDSNAGTSNVVLALDSSGNLTIGGTATPTFQATGGQFTLSGNTLLLTTTAGTNSDIIASPSGMGKIDLNKPIQNTSNNNNLSTSAGAVEVDDLLAVLATSSGQSAFTVNQNSTGPLISASSSGTAKFTVDNSGNTTIAGNVLSALTASRDLGSSSVRWNNLWVQTMNATGTNTSGQASFTYDPLDTTYTQATVLINPTSAGPNEALLGLGIGGVERARIDTEGDAVFGFASGTLTPNSNPLTLYNHGTTQIASVDTSGALTLSGAITAPTSTNTINNLVINAGALSNISTISMSGQLTSTLATGTAPFVVASTTNVANLNASSLNGATFAAPGTIGGGTAAAGTFTTLTGNTSITDGGLTTAGVVLNSSAGLLSTLAGTTTTVLHGNAAGAPTFASVSGNDLASDITISTTGNISTTGTGTITSAGLLTASNGLTLTTGALSLTGTSGSIALTGFGTTSLTSTTASGNINTLADSSLNTDGANLANLTFTNTNTTSTATTVNGVSITPTATANANSNANTLNSINLPNVTAHTNNTFNALNLGTGYNNIIVSGNVTLTAAGALTIASLQVNGTINSTSTVTGTQLISSVSTGTAPLSVTSTTVVPNLNVSQLQGYVASDLYSQPQPNLVLNSDFGRRNKWMTFMPETFPTETPAAQGWTSASTLSVSSNQLTIATANKWAKGAGGNFVWRDARWSAQFQITSLSGQFILAKYVDANDALNSGSDIEVEYVNNNFSIYKTIAGTRTLVANVADGTLTLNNYYWLELETQGSTVIGKIYSSGASPVAKSSTTLIHTLTGTVSDSQVISGGIGLLSDQANSVWGGLSTGDGGVYVEGWGPESWTVDYSDYSTVLGGQAIGFDESTDSGPNGKQWAVRTYIPATSRGIGIYQDVPGNSGSVSNIIPSTNYTASGYWKTSGKGGSGFLASYLFQQFNTSNGAAANFTRIGDAGETSWTQGTTTATTNANARRARIWFEANASGTATGTAFFDLPQLEQGSVATPWRNAPADDEPIVWVVKRAAGVAVNTSSASYSEIDSRNLAGNFFLPWDANIRSTLDANPDNNTSGAFSAFGFYFDGTVPTSTTTSQAGFTAPAAGSVIPVHFNAITTVSSGKHRIAAGWYAGTGTLRLATSDSVYDSAITVVATRGKFDLAEEYTVQDTSINAGDVVRLARNTTNTTNNPISNTTIEKSTGGYDGSVLGIVSTAPGITLASQVELNSYQEKPNLRPVALSGRVPVKVTNENGPIHRGDTLTSSATYQGYAMKAIKAGPAIGIAMEDFNPSDEGNTTNTTNNTNNPIIQFGKIMTFVNLSWYDPDVYLTDSGSFVINKVSSAPVATLVPNDVSGSSYLVSSGSATLNTKYQIPNTSATPTCDPTIDPSNFGLMSTCPKEPTLTEKTIQQISSVNYTVSDSLGNTVERIGAFSQAVIGSLKAGAIDAKDVIADNLIINNKIISPIAEVNIVRTNVITPLGEGKIVIRPNETSASSSALIKPILEIQNASGSAVATIDTAGNATFSGQLKSDNLTANSASISGTLNSFGLVTESASVSGTLRTKNLIADNIDSQVANIRKLIAGFQTSQKAADVASYSAQLSYVSNLNATTAIFAEGFSSLGPASLTDTSITGQLSVDANLILADNSINVLGGDLNLQPLKQGGISFLSGKVYIDVNGNMTINGNATVAGTLFANVLSPIPGNDLIFKLATSSGRFVVQNASGSAVANIDQNGNATFRKLNLSIVSPAFALSENEVMATGSAGIATISARQKEITVDNKLVTDKSLIYISPVGLPADGTSAQIPFLLRQVSGESFTVGTQTIGSSEVPFNWLIIN